MLEVQTKTKQEDACLLGYIDLLLGGGLIEKGDVSMLKDKYSTCEDLYSALESLGVIDLKKLTKLFAEAKGISYIDVKSIDKKAYSLVDRDTARAFSFIPFAIDEKAKSLQVAIADPLKISRVSRASLSSMEKKIGYKIELFLTSKLVLDELPLLVDEGGDFPRVDLSSYWIEENVLRKIPYDLAFKYKIIIFKQISSKEYNVAVGDAADRSILLMLEQMEKKAGIKFNIYSAPLSQLEKTLKDYRTLLDASVKQAKEEEREKAEIVRDLEKGAEKLAKQQEAQQKNAISNLEDENIANEVKNSEYSDQSDKENIDLLSVTNQGSLGSRGIGRHILDNSVSSESNGESAADSGDEKKDENGQQSKQIDKLENPDLAKIVGSQKMSVEMIKQFAGQGSIPQLVASIISLAIDQEASDIHVEPFEKSVKLRYRIDGQLADIAELPSQIRTQISARVKILAKLKLDEQRVPQDGRFDVTSGKEVVDIRVSTLPTVFGEKVVMRLLSKTKKLDDLPDLGIDGLNFDRIISAISKPYGVILATGPTGSGKSTTLYSVFSRLNKPEVNIITLEDPVEYEIDGINQVQVKPQIGFSFAEGLRSVLRQDPNIIMVGEIRDGETAELAVQAALTGHLVFSTLHTNDASGALPRMYNLGVEPFLLTSAINAVIGQRLVRRICPKCRQEVALPQSVLFQVKKELESLNLNLPIKFYKGKGCSECKEGFKGRLGIYEVLEMTKAIEDLVLDKKSSSEIFDQAVKEGMITMKQDGLIKAIKGVTTVDEVFRVTREQNEEG